MRTFARSLAHAPALLLLTLAACRDPVPASIAPAAGTGSAPRAPGQLRATPVRLAIGGGAGEVPDTQVIVRFENAGDTACVLQGYELRWMGGPSSIGLGGSHRCAAAGAAVPARGAIETTCTLPSRTQLGAAPGMTVANTTVSEVQATCDPVP
jgi:hypothetical protein